MTSITRRGFVKAAALAPVALTHLAEGTAQADAQQASRPAAPAEPFDYVFAGAGHNALVCAAYVAKAGFKVLVLEGRSLIGGGAKTAEILLPGFKQDLCSSNHAGFMNNPAMKNNELGLRDYGYDAIDPEVVMHYPFLDGSSFTVYHEDPARTIATIARVSKKDADTFRRLLPVREKYLAAPAAERTNMREAVFFERLGTMSGYEAAKLVWESPQMRAAGLAGGHFGGVPGSDPGSGAQTFSLMGQLAGRPMPKGGSGMLTVALGRAIEAKNGVVLTNKGVTRLLIESGKCVGVECADGSTYRARRAVVSTIHVKHLVDMAPRELWGDEFVERTNLWAAEHSMFAFHFALSEHPKYPMAGGGTTTSPEAALLQHAESIFTLNSDRARGELTLDDVPLQIVTPSSVDPSRTPAGMATLKIEGTLPYELEGGADRWDSVKEQVADKLLTYYMKLTTNITREKILATSLFSPLDIERMNPAMWRGSVHHSDRRFTQTMPYRSKIPGLYLTGGCTGSGGSVTGNPGRGAAAEILKDAGMTIEQVANRGRTA